MTLESYWVWCSRCPVLTVIDPTCYISLILWLMRNLNHYLSPVIHAQAPYTTLSGTSILLNLMGTIL